MAVRNRGDGEGTIPKRLGALEKLADAEVLFPESSEEGGPASQLTEDRFADHEAEICDLAFDQRETAVAAGEEIELHGVVESGGLGSSKPPMELESDQIGLEAVRAWPAAKVVFPGGEEDVGRGHGFAGGELGGPGPAVADERFHRDATADGAPFFGCTRQQGLIEDVTGEGKGREGEPGFHHTVGNGEAEDVDLLGA